MGLLQKGNSLNYPSFFYLGFWLVFLNIPVCQTSFWSCAFGIWSNRGIHVIFIFLLSISLNGWNLRTLFYLKHSPSCTLSLFKYNWVNQVIRGSPEMCEAELDYFVRRIKIKRVIKQSHPSGTSVLASQGWQGMVLHLCHAGSSKLCSSEFFTPLMCKHLFDSLEILRQDCRNSYHVLYRKPEVLLP